MLIIVDWSFMYKEPWKNIWEQIAVVLLHIMDLSILIGLAYFMIASLRFLRIKLIPYKNTFKWLLGSSQQKLDEGNFITVIAIFAQYTNDAKYIRQTKYYYWFWDIWVKTSEARSVPLRGNGNGGIPCWVCALFPEISILDTEPNLLAIYLNLFSFFFSLFPHFKSSTKFSD